jgi:hypothetical protein
MIFQERSVLSSWNCANSGQEVEWLQAIVWTPSGPVGPDLWKAAISMPIGEHLPPGTLRNFSAASLPRTRNPVGAGPHCGP